MRPRACQLEPGWASELKSRPHAHTCTPCIADTSGKAPALIVEKGGLLVADGRAEAPITFTALNPETTSTATVDSDTASEDGNAALQTRGKWGGLILLGKAPTNTPTSREVEERLATRSFELHPAYDRRAEAIDRDIRAAAPAREACARGVLLGAR